MNMNLEFYKGEDFYSDGEIEEEILAIVREQQDFIGVLAKDNRWPLLYHLSPLRRNLLEWYSFDERHSLLEIGAGCGALTGLFCENAKRVVAVELSKRRAEILALRHRQRENLEVIVGNLEDIQFKEKFQVITLIGVLEYAGRFSSGGDPFLDFLKKVKSLLSPDGVLIIAIENKFGLKYWSGAKEDHYAKYFTGIENYVLSNDIRTFGKNEFTNLLTKAGFISTQFYYPYPDYKICEQIFSDSYIPTPGQFNWSTDNYDNNRYQIFNEKLSLSGIIQEGRYDFFANSFLVFAKEGV